MSDVTATDRASGDFERYGLLAAMTLVVLCLLLADRVRSAPRASPPPSADRRLRIRIGGAPDASATLQPRHGLVAPPVVPPAPPGSALDRSQIGPASSGTSRANAASPAPRSGQAAGPAGGVRPDPRSSPLPPVARTCVVGEGETLGDIALRELGTSKRAREIADLNGIANVHQIRTGQTLRLPPK